MLTEALYDLVIGNIEGAREHNDPDPSWAMDKKISTKTFNKVEHEKSTVKKEEF